ncbi:MAG TPA: hypothetical protein DEA55_10035 [Rhodospirillaceae bacterium]|nr:hypothetical protein [Rhodospirillaceae bacterium]
MSYIRKVITNEEKLLSTFRPHWIYFFEGAFWFAGLTVIGFIADYYLYVYFGQHAVTFDIDLKYIHFSEMNTPIPWLFSFAGLAVFWPLFLLYISTEVGLTNQRIIHKRGLIFIEIDQVDLEDIRAEHVVHGWFGWLLGYGKIKLNCRFIEDVILPAIRNPYRLVKASHTARLKHPLIEYGQDEFRANMERIDQQREKSKIISIKEAIKKNFRKAA